LHRREEIWYTALDPVIGSEQAKTRPCVILNASGIGRSTARIVVPITGWKTRHRAFTWMVEIQPDSLNGLTKVSGADASQVRTVDTLRFLSKIGTLDVAVTESIVRAVALCLDYK
jgi:mRNA interferase MazF